MQTYDVLVFPFGTEIANEIVQSLRNNKTFRLVLASSDPAVIGDLEPGYVARLPFVSDRSFEQEFKALVERTGAAFAVPAHDDVALALSLMDLGDACRVIGQPASVNEIVRFKDRTYSVLAEHVPVPAVFTDTATDMLPYPLFVKPRRGQGSRGAVRLDSAEHLRTYLDGKHRRDYVVTEYLPGDEYTIDCFSTRGVLRFAGPRTRERTVNGISVRSRPVSDSATRTHLIEMGRKISAVLQMDGLWFFQAKRDASGEPKLLEVGPRVSGTMMLNRVRGVNFVELALYQALGHDVDIQEQPFDVTVTRSLQPRFHHDLAFDTLYVDFDDTLLLDGNRINTDVMTVIFAAKNQGKKVFLITRNRNNKLASTLHRFGISSIFDGIHHLSDTDRKSIFLGLGDLLLDDSFSERAEAREAGALALGLDALQLFRD